MAPLRSCRAVRERVLYVKAWASPCARFITFSVVLSCPCMDPSASCLESRFANYDRKAPRASHTACVLRTYVCCRHAPRHIAMPMHGRHSVYSTTNLHALPIIAAQERMMSLLQHLLFVEVCCCWNAGLIISSWSNVLLRVCRVVHAKEPRCNYYRFIS